LANIVRKPPARFSGSCIVRSSGMMIRIAVPGPMFRMRLRGILFGGGRKNFRAYREPIPLPRLGNYAGAGYHPGRPAA
jgi:hypothetical protein